MKISGVVESDAGGDSHAFEPLLIAGHVGRQRDERASLRQET